MKKILAFVVLSIAIPSLHAAPYKVDAAHSQVMFKVRHLISTVTGRFDKFEGSFDYDSKNLAGFKSKGTIDATSINTNNSKRDEHLRSPDFFDTAKYPTLEFSSTSVSDLKGTKGKLKGNLTIHGVTKPVVFDVEFLGTGKDPWGNEKAALTATTTINRTDFGLKWNQALETGGVLVGEEVQIILEIEGNLSK